MDHMTLLNQIRQRNTLDQAFEYACYDRMHTDHYVSLFELEYVQGHRSQVLEELVTELADTDTYRQRPAFAFFPPKTDLCFRRMVYLNFKDLVLRYAFVIVFARFLDASLSPTCFANRRATGEQASRSLLADFAKESWPNFCNWQREQAQYNTTLLRTDISSFYDSISHDYLIRIFAKEFSVAEDSSVMKLFRKVLTVPVLICSRGVSGGLQLDEMRQGLPIGNNCEGFFANVYLQAIDALMSSQPGINFGRYNDDMRIFGNSRREVLEGLRVLQELLLTKGLNLNTSKTHLAENEQEIEELRSQDTDVYQYFPEIDDRLDEESRPKIQAESILGIDRPFDEFDRTFGPDEELTSHKDGKDFCKFLTMQSRDGETGDLSDRSGQQVRQLKTVLKEWSGSSRHAAWLLVQSAFERLVSPQARLTARNVLLDVLNDKHINSYAKYRILHHLAKLRRARDGKEFCFLDFMSSEELRHLRQILATLLEASDFELVTTALYTYKAIGKSEEELRNLIQRTKHPNAEPYQNILLYVGSELFAFTPASLATENEADETIQPY